MNKELVELYLEGFKKGYWTDDNRGNIRFGVPSSWTEKIYGIESPRERDYYAQNGVDSWRRKIDAPEYAEAARQWRKLKMSKLWRSIK